MTTTLELEESFVSHGAVATVPSMHWAKRYISRKIGGVRDLDMATWAMDTATNILIQGPTGAGKTSFALAYAAKNGLPFYSTPSSNGIEPSSLFGRPMSVRPGYFPWVDGPVTYIIRNGGLLLVNEVNFLPPRVSTSLFSAFDDRREITLLDNGGEVVRAHRPNCWCDLAAAECRKKWVLIIADCNPRDYKGTVDLNAAFRNRFGIQLYWDYDPVVDRKLVPYDSLRKLMDKLRGTEEIVTPVPPSMMANFASHVRDRRLGWDFAVAVLVNRFDSEEGRSVSMVIDTFRIEIRRQLLQLEPNVIVTDDGSIWNADDYDLKKKGTKETPNPINFPHWNAAMGIYLVDWRLEND